MPIRVRNFRSYKQIHTVLTFDGRKRWNLRPGRFVMSSVTESLEEEFVGHVAAHNAKEKKKFPFRKLFPQPPSPSSFFLPGAELPSWKFWPSQRPFSISLDPGRRPSSFFYLRLADVLFDVILPSVLGSSLWFFDEWFPIKYLLNCSGGLSFARLQFDHFIPDACKRHNQPAH